MSNLTQEQMAALGGTPAPDIAAVPGVSTLTPEQMSTLNSAVIPEPVVEEEVIDEAGESIVIPPSPDLFPERGKTARRMADMRQNDLRHVPQAGADIAEALEEIKPTFGQKLLDFAERPLSDTFPLLVGKATPEQFGIPREPRTAQVRYKRGDLYLDDTSYNFPGTLYKEGTGHYRIAQQDITEGDWIDKQTRAQYSRGQGFFEKHKDSALVNSVYSASRAMSEGAFGGIGGELEARAGVEPFHPDRDDVLGQFAYGGGHLASFLVDLMATDRAMPWLGTAGFKAMTGLGAGAKTAHTVNSALHLGTGGLIHNAAKLKDLGDAATTFKDNAIFGAIFGSVGAKWPMERMKRLISGNLAIEALGAAERGEEWDDKTFAEFTSGAVFNTFFLWANRPQGFDPRFVDTYLAESLAAKSDPDLVARIRRAKENNLSKEFQQIQAQGQMQEKTIEEWGPFAEHKQMTEAVDRSLASLESIEANPEAKVEWEQKMLPKPGEKVSLDPEALEFKGIEVDEIPEGVKKLAERTAAGEPVREKLDPKILEATQEGEAAKSQDIVDLFARMQKNTRSEETDRIRNPEKFEVKDEKETKEKEPMEEEADVSAPDTADAKTAASEPAVIQLVDSKLEEGGPVTIKGFALIDEGLLNLNDVATLRSVYDKEVEIARETYKGDPDGMLQAAQRNQVFRELADEIEFREQTRQAQVDSTDFAEKTVETAQVAEVAKETKDSELITVTDDAGNTTARYKMIEGTTDIVNRQGKPYGSKAATSSTVKALGREQYEAVKLGNKQWVIRERSIIEPEEILIGKGEEAEIDPLGQKLTQLETKPKEEKLEKEPTLEELMELETQIERGEELAEVPLDPFDERIEKGGEEGKQFKQQALSEFEQTAEETASLTELFKSPRGIKAAGDDPNTYLRFIKNEINRALNGEDVSIKQAMNDLEDFKQGMFQIQTQMEVKDFERMQLDVDGLYSWASGLGEVKPEARVKAEEEIKLFGGIPEPKEFVKAAKALAGMKQAKKELDRPKFRAQAKRFLVKTVDPARESKISLEDMGESGYEAVTRYLNAQGAGAEAMLQMKLMDKSVYKGLDQKHTEILNEMLFLKRIDELRYSDEGKDPEKQLKNPGGITFDDARAILDNADRFWGISEGEANRLKKRMPQYFDFMRKELDVLLDKHMISQESYDKLIKFDYIRRESIRDEIDPLKTVKVGKKKTPISVRDSGVDAIRQGTESDVLELDSRLLAAEVILRSRGRIKKNEANLALREVAIENKDNPIISLGVKKTERKGTKSKTKWEAANGEKDWVPANVWREGKREKIFLEPDFAAGWITRDADMSPMLAKMVSWGLGVPVLKMFATGNNLGFALRNLPRDMQHIWLTSQIRGEDGQWISTYSPHGPVAIAQQSADMGLIMKDTLTRGPKYEQFIEAGGGMEFMVDQGKLFRSQYGLLPGTGMKRSLSQLQETISWLSETSEISTRLMLVERALKQIAKREKTTVDKSRNNEEQYAEAVRISREYLNFSEGGGWSKAANQFVPYFNATVQATRGMFRAAQRDHKTFMYKMSQVMALESSMANASKFANPDVWNAIDEDTKRNYWILTLPKEMSNALGYIDKDDQTMPAYFAIPKDQGQRFAATLARAAWSKSWGEEVKPEDLMTAFTELAPIPGSMVPPSLRAYVAAAAGKDMRSFSEIYDVMSGPEVDPSAEFTETMGSREGTPEVFKQIGEVTGASPKRLQKVLQAYFTGSNIWTQAVGVGVDAALGNINPNEINWDKAVIENKITSGFYRVANFSRSALDKHLDVAQEVSTERQRGYKKIDKFLNQAIYEGKPEALGEIERIIGSTEDPDLAKEYTERVDFTINLQELRVTAQDGTKAPTLKFWLSVRNDSSKARAITIGKILSTATPELEQQLLTEASILFKPDSQFWDELATFQIQQGLE